MDNPDMKTLHFPLKILASLVCFDSWRELISRPNLLNFQAHFFRACSKCVFPASSLCQFCRSIGHTANI